MKAKKYYERYGQAVLDEALSPEQKTEALAELFTAFIREMKEILTERQVKTDRGAVAVIKEQNEKWNALCAIYEKNHGMEILKRNGFLEYMKMQIPALKIWEAKNNV